MILLSHPTGNENVRQAALAFREADLLGEFWTCLSWDPDRAMNRVLPKRVRKQLARRSFPSSIRPLIHTVPSREVGRLLFGLPGIDVVLQDLDRRVAARLEQIENCDLVYAYEDGALDTFRAAKNQGIRRVYDLPIGYWRVAQQIYAEESKREPEWAKTLTGTRDSDEKLERKEEELTLANRVVVASSFTKQTLAAANFSATVDVIPYGAPAVTENEIASHAKNLRVLFAGSLGQRKGLSYLLQAVELLGSKVELTLLGRKAASDCRPLEAATREHRWIPSLPHHEVLREMQQHDVLVLPSLFEGFGLVIPEAMAQGLVVIATAHTAGPDLIDNGIDGFIVPIRSAEAIAEKLEMLAQDRDQLREMKLAARKKAARLRWEDYRRRLVEMAREVVIQP
jgi:glycosyltransferase involved in cell wall biosynthesis